MQWEIKLHTENVFDRLIQKKIKSSSKEYVKNVLEILTNENCFPKTVSKPMRVFIYIITENNCSSQHFAVFIQTQKRYPTFFDKV